MLQGNSQVTSTCHSPTTWALGLPDWVPSFSNRSKCLVLTPEDPVALSVKLLMLQPRVTSHGLTFNTCATSKPPRWLVINTAPFHKTKMLNLPCTILMVLFDLFPGTQMYFLGPIRKYTSVLLSFYAHQESEPWAWIAWDLNEIKREVNIYWALTMYQDLSFLLSFSKAMPHKTHM